MSEDILIKLQDGLVVLVIGFSTVFIFLTIMIFAMYIQAGIVAWLNKIFPVAVAESASSKGSKSAKTSDDTEIAIAIACAALKENHG